MVHHGHFLLERVIGGTPEHGLEYGAAIGLKGESIIQDAMQLVFVADWQPSISELADGARFKLTVEQLVAHEDRQKVHIAEIQAKCKPFEGEHGNTHLTWDAIFNHSGELSMATLGQIGCFKSWAYNFTTFITQGK